jgi:asparagine synthase (glutamine-hydrolysing)
MCGIAGVLGRDRDRVTDAVKRATGAQRHRGPDDAGTIVLPFGPGWVGLGHRRLSILDLSPLGHQPMALSDAGPWITFNGEIYNFIALRKELEAAGDRFRGTGDTEVLLAALARWGPPALSRLQGMYAFAYYDPARSQLLLARDPAGIKPLYLADAGGTLVFASEVRGILATGLARPDLDPRGVAGVLAYGAVQHPTTLFAGITSLAPGSYQEFEPTADGRWRASGPPVTFWRFPLVQGAATFEKAVEDVRATLEAAVRDHLVADVPVGVFLSSGLDSTIVAGLAARHSPKLRSFTVGFDDSPDLCEQRLAAETARLFGLSHTAIELSASEALAATQEWLASIDQPSMDGLNVYVISRAVRQQGIKVALSGLGGDELFGGYPSFHDVPRLYRWLRRLRWLPAAARRTLASLLALGGPESYRGKLADMFGCSGRFLSLYLHRRRALSDRQFAELGIEAGTLWLTEDFLPPETVADIPADPDDLVRAVGEMESRFYQGNMLLRDADANGMAHGLEIRVPFLDRRLLDLVHALPGSVRLTRGAPQKYLLRQAFSPLLRPKLLRQLKRGFVLPIGRWMAGPLRGWCEQSLRVWHDLGWPRPAGIDRIWQAFLREPESPVWTRAFTLCVLGHYLAGAGATGAESWEDSFRRGQQGRPGCTAAFQ